jgi:hypothetical protein
MIQGTEQAIELKWNFLGGAPHSHSIVQTTHSILKFLYNFSRSRTHSGDGSGKKLRF